MTYGLADILAGDPHPNEPVRYRDLVLRRKYHTREYIVTCDDGLIIEFDAQDFEDPSDLSQYLDKLSDETDVEATPVATPTTDGGTTALKPTSAYERNALERTYGVSVTMGTACLVIGLLSLLGAGATMATAPIGVAWMVQLVAGLLLGGVGIRLRGGRR